MPLCCRTTVRSPWASDLEEACDRLELLEWLCEVHLRVVQLGGGRTLSSAELDAVRLQLGSDRYGQRRPSA